MDGNMDINRMNIKMNINMDVGGDLSRMDSKNELIKGASTGNGGTNNNDNMNGNMNGNMNMENNQVTMWGLSGGENMTAGVLTPSSEVGKKRQKKVNNVANTEELPLKHRQFFKVKRYFTSNEPSKSPLDNIRTVKSNSKIKDTDGKTVFEMKDIEAPETWSQLAVDIMVSKYFRKAGVPETGHETSASQVVYRIAHTLRVAGEKMGYFDAESAHAFENELLYLLINQVGAFNSPVWFNLGLYHEYGIQGSGGSFAWDEQQNRIVEVGDAYSRPQCSACFIQSVDDDLMSVFQLVKNEAKLFKYGSGTGTNFSKIRGRQEKLSGGGYSSGLMSFLEVFDKGAGATKSGGTTRRAAKMVSLDMDHPEIMDFITWKSREERKVAALIAAGYSSDFNGEAYKTVGGQNSNNSLRITDEFMKAVETGAPWSTRARTTGEVVDTYEARSVWKTIAESAWACADPGLQFDTTINDWHTCQNTDRIRASNPCSEYMFLDDSACNLASLNLVKFLKEDGSFDLEGYRHAVRVFIAAQEILVGLSSYPTEKIAKNSYDYRPLGLGYANLGTLLMLKGIPYDSDEGRAWASTLTSIMSGRAYAVSAEMAGAVEPFAGYTTNKDCMLGVISKHRDAAYALSAGVIMANEKENANYKALLQAARADWDYALALGEKNGYRNSQVSVLAPTGTIGLLMDCDTTGVEPDFALVKFKKLAGGGYFKIVNQSVPAALKNLGYSEAQLKDVLTYVLGTLHLKGTPHVNQDFLKAKGLTQAEIEKLEKSLVGSFELSSAFSKFTLGEETLKRIGVKAEELAKPSFSFLTWAGLTPAQIAEANEVICGTMTVEGAPHIKPEHLAVFDCANKCGSRGKRFIAPMGHVKMMAAVQPFLSGAISKTVNVPNESTVENIADIYFQSWKLGLKAIALYRDGCKLSQPLSSQSSSSTTGSTAGTTETKKAEVAVQPPVVVQKEMKGANGEKIIIQPVSPVRRKMPNKRRGFTQEASIAGHKVYLRTGEYDDQTLGEVFIDMHKEGAAYRSMMNCFAISVSLGLQYGVPLNEFVDKFTFTRFEPSGVVEGHPNVKMVTSIVDYIFRVLGMEYLGRTDFVQVKPVVDLTTEKGAAAVVYPKDPTKAKQEAVSTVNQVPKNETKTSGAIEVAIAESLSGHLAEMMGDAPPCDSCGHTTVRNGACYKCLNCGNSMGCS